MEIKRSIKGVRPFIISLFLVLTLATNVSATQVSDKSESVEVVEDKEDELMGTTKPSSFSRAALSIPAEGVYDTIKDTKNSAGVMIERRFYKSGKLTEKRTYTSTGSTDCRMRNKYLYYSDGATLERHRTYLNTGATCYNTNTKRYGTNKKLEWQLIYDGSKGYAKEGRYYDITAAYYTRIDYYTAGKKTIKHYWLGATGNRVTHVANLNSAGTEWLKATYYYDYTNKKVKQVINYTGKTPNLRTNETYYGTTGIKEWYRTYDSAGDQYHLTYYQANGVKKQEARYLKGTGVWTWDIKYQTNGIDRESVRYRNEDNIYTRQLYYYAAGSKLKYDILYDEEGIKTSAKVYDEATGKLKQDEWYVDGKIDVVEYYNLEGETTRKARYFKDGTHLRWDINYVDNEKESVKLYDNENNYEYKETYKYTDDDSKLTNILIEYKKEKIEDDNMFSIFKDEIFSTYIQERIELVEESDIYIEDFKVIDRIEVKNSNILEENYNALSNDSSLVSVEGTTTTTEEANEMLKGSIFNNIDGIMFLTELEVLKINNSEIHSLPVEDFSYFKKIKEIDLSSNKITAIDDSLQDLKTLEIIQLSNNDITSTKDIFSNLYNIKEIDISNNPILFLSKDFENLKNNGNLNTVNLENVPLRIRETDSEDLKKLLNNDIFKYNKENGLKDIRTVKIYSDDVDMNYKDIIFPEDNITKLIDFSNSGSEIRYKKIDSNPDYDISEKNSSVEKYKDTIVDSSKLDSLADLNNYIFNETGTYFIHIKSGDINFDSVIKLRVYNKSTGEIAKEYANSNVEPVENDEEDELFNAINDDSDKLISNKEQKEIEIQAEIMGEFESIQDQMTEKEKNSLSGAYFNKDNKLVIQTTNTNLIQKINLTRNTSKNLKFETKKLSYDELKKIVGDIRSVFPNLNYTVQLDEENNIIEISSDDNNTLKKLKSTVSNVDLEGELDIEYKLIDKLEVNPKKKWGISMASKLNCGGSKATFGYRAKKYVKYIYKNKKGKKKTGYKYIYGASVADHMNCIYNGKKNTIYKGNKAVGTPYNTSKAFDTTFVWFRYNKASAQRKLSYRGNYHSNTSEIVVKNMKVIALTNQYSGNKPKWRSTKITSTCTTEDKPCYIQTGEITFKGDSGGPLVYEVKKKNKKGKKYTHRTILGTLYGSFSDYRDYWPKVTDSKNDLDIWSY